MRRNPTPAEAKLWSRIRKRQLAGFKFRRQHIIAGFIVDFYCPTLELIVEVDGPIHRYQPSQDAWRTRILQARGLHVVRFSSEAVMDETEKVLLSLERTIHNRRLVCCPG